MAIEIMSGMGISLEIFLLLSLSSLGVKLVKLWLENGFRWAQITRRLTHDYSPKIWRSIIATCEGRSWPSTMSASKSRWVKSLVCLVRNGPGKTTCVAFFLRCFVRRMVRRSSTGLMSFRRPHFSRASSALCR